jgi:hypothetical protein
MDTLLLFIALVQPPCTSNYHSYVVVLPLRIECWCLICGGVIATDNTPTLPVRCVKPNFAAFGTYSENRSVKKSLMGIKTFKLVVIES